MKNAPSVHKAAPLTIIGIAADSRLAAGDGANRRARLAAIAMIFAGAAVGAGLVTACGLGLALVVQAPCPRWGLRRDRA